MGLLIVAMVFVVVITVVAVVFSRPDDALLLAIAPVVVVLVAALISLSHLDVDVTDQGVGIAFRGLWPTRIGFAEIVGSRGAPLQPASRVRRLGRAARPEGLGLHDDRQRRRAAAPPQGPPVLIGSARPRELEAAIRAGVESQAPTPRRAS